ncbi:MAG: GIY-YIG nuclease family protein [Lachnospiraceae bacterium]|nr:GIY-YIG nuclease family protein [Lachnospiraceae bacterium]
MPDIFDQYTHQRPDINPTVYVYEDTNPLYRGYLKVGYTVRPVIERVEEQYPTLRPATGAPFTILHYESALYNDGGSFRDEEVHAALKRRGIHPARSRDGRETEFYKCTLDDVKAAIIAVKTRSANEENRTLTFSMRPEQQEAVEKTATYFFNEALHNPTRTTKFLWNCKMRFGKTFAAYQLAKRMRLYRTLVLTFKPAVEDAWEEDLMRHVDFEGWQFYSRKTQAENGKTPEDLDQRRPIVCFGSFQDYLGTNESGGIKAKNEWVHTINWDLVIFDEYHFGAWRENAKKLFQMEDDDSYDTLDIEKYKKEEADNAYNESFLPITTKYYLFLSGTPFRALNNGEFIEDQIYSWTYSDEQRAKEEWPKLSRFPGFRAAPGAANPYAALPRMVLMTYKMPDEIRNIAYNSDLNEFDLNEFFKAKVDARQPLREARFVHENSVQKWLNLIRGSFMPTTLDELRVGNGDKPAMPYADARLLNILTHTFWFLPSVASCYAMAELLARPVNTFYHDYTINICAGTGAGIGLAALAPVRESMSPALATKSITLSCGKLTTGVTVRPWTGIFMLRNLSSPETYFQAAFRVQSPWTMTREDQSQEIMKRECYIFDFAIDRALREIADYSCNLDVNETNPEKKVADFVNFLPVLAYDGSSMTAVSAADILDMTMAGTSATLLARRWESALLVNVDNETLQRILDSEEALKALENIEGFRALNKDIETIINRSNAVKKLKQKGEALTPKEKKELSEAEKEYKSKRKMIQEKLIKFAARIPIFMYLTDFREYTLKDVITQFEPALFRKVTGLTLKDFDLLVSLGVFNDTLMNDAVYHFKRYEDASLEYTGINRHSGDESVGLFSTIITREEYEHMDELQNASMAAKAKRAEARENRDSGKVIQMSEKPSETPKKTLYSEVKPVPVPIVAEKKPPVKPPVSAPEESARTIPVVDPSVIRPGVKVHHKRFGVGTVMKRSEKDADGKYSVQVEFKNGGVKLFQAPMVFENRFLTLI